MLPLGRGETVLVIESEREQLLCDEEMLAALGYEPVGFEHPADAIAACRATPDRFDILLVSHASQTDRGLDLAHALREIAPRHPLLLATASTIDVSIDALAEAGISRCCVGRRSAPNSRRRARRCLRSPGTLRL
jgi:DNA-binding NtrC family response regulator